MSILFYPSHANGGLKPSAKLGWIYDGLKAAFTWFSERKKYKGKDSSRVPALFIFYVKELRASCRYRLTSVASYDQA